MLILAVVGQTSLERSRHRGKSESDQSTNADKGISASRLSDITTIPRQTVRRKLQDLRTRGWIEQLPEGRWRLSEGDGVPHARIDLADLTDRTIARVAGLIDTLRELGG